MFAKRRRHTYRARLGKRKKKILIIKTFLFVFATSFMFVGFIWIANNKYFLIDTIAVTGNESVSDDVLIKFTEEKLKGNFFFLVPKSNIAVYPKDDIEEAIKTTFNKISGATMITESLTAVNLIIKERKPYAQWCESAGATATTTAKCYFLDEFGFIFTKSPDFTGNVFFKYMGDIDNEENTNPIGKQYLDRELFRGLNFFMESLGEISLEPVSLTRVNEEDFEVKLKDGSRILFSKNKNLSIGLDNLRVAIESGELDTSDKKIDYIDIRFGNKIFYKYK